MDTSGWYAYFDRSEPGHQEVKKAIAGAGEVVTSNFVVDEALTLILAREGHGAAVRAGQGFWSGVLGVTVRVNEEDEREAWSLFQRSEGLSYTDCTSMALMKRLRLSTAVTLDRDFVRQGFNVVPALRHG